MGRLMFVPLLAGVLCLAACGEEETSAPSLSAQSAGEQAGVAVADVGSGPEAESAEAGQGEAAVGLGKGDSQLGDDSGASDVGAVATEESDAPIQPEPNTQVAAGGEQEAASAFAGEESERIPEDSGEVVADQEVDWRGLALILAAAIVLVALVAVGLLGWVLGRRGAVAPPIPGVAPGAPNATAGQNSMDRAPTVLVATADGLRELKGELLDAILTFQNVVNEKDAKIKRYEEGYDLAVSKGFLQGFIKVDLALLNALKKNPEDKDLQELQRFLENAFEVCRVRRFYPKVGSLYSKERGVQDHPKSIPINDESSVGCIAEVVEPGYEFTEQANEPILRGAKVQIYRFAGKKEEA